MTATRHRLSLDAHSAIDVHKKRQRATRPFAFCWLRTCAPGRCYCGLPNLESSIGALTLTSFSVALKRPSSHALAGLQDIAARMRRGTRAFLGYPVAAIQNDTPVNDTDYDDCLTPSLRPLELIGALDLQPRSRSFSPRSPRGPPLSA